MQKQDGEIIWIRNESEGDVRPSHSLTYSPLDKELNLFLRDDRSWKFMYREQRRRPDPGKKRFRVGTGRWQMERRIMLPAGWWGKCDCELSFDAMQIGQRGDIRAAGFCRTDTPLLFTNSNRRIHNDRARGLGYCNRTRVCFLFTMQGIRSRQLYVNFDECWLTSIYSNWFIDCTNDWWMTG